MSDWGDHWPHVTLITWLAIRSDLTDSARAEKTKQLSSPDWGCQHGAQIWLALWLRSGEWRLDQRDDLTRSVYKSENYAGTWLTTYVMCMFSFSIELEYYNIIPSLCLNYIKCNLSEWLLYYGLLQSTNKPLISTLYIKFSLKFFAWLESWKLCGEWPSSRIRPIAYFF